ITQAASNAGIPELEAATDCLTAAVASYRAVLDAMAEARTEMEWQSRHTDVQKSLLLLEHFWTQTTNETLAAAAAQGPITASLLGLVGQWLTWTKNAGELGLRQRERILALAATQNCVDPELMFAETDPFWNSHLVESK